MTVIPYIHIFCAMLNRLCGARSGSLQLDQLGLTIHESCKGKGGGGVNSGVYESAAHCYLIVPVTMEIA